MFRSGPLMDGVQKMICTSGWVVFGTLRDNALWLTSHFVFIDIFPQTALALEGFLLRF